MLGLFQAVATGHLDIVEPPYVQAMAIGKKGARLLEVDGVRYRWRIRKKPTYCQALGWTGAIFAVEAVENPGTSLVVELDQPHPSNWMGLAAIPITPADVAQWIRQGHSRGWKPHQKGSPLVIKPARQ